MVRRMFPASSLTFSGIFRDCLIARLSRNECEAVVTMPEPHTIDTVTAHDRLSVGKLLRTPCIKAKRVWHSQAGCRYDDSAS